MLIKIAIILVLAVIVWRWAFGTWPWDGLSGGPAREDRIARARRILGVGRRADRAQIVAAHRKLLSRVHPDRGGSSAEVHEANEARDLLLAELPGGDGAGGGKDGERGGESGDGGSTGD